jgi:hypothetical protein
MNIVIQTVRRAPRMQTTGAQLLSILLCWAGISPALATPKITTQPTNQFVSLGANVTHTVSATTTVPPLSYQWRFNDTEIANATKRTLILTNVLVANAGGYSVVVTDSSGSVTSRVAQLDVDPAFTMITAGPIVTDTGTSATAAWGDYDNDGFPDLLVGNIVEPNFLYRNRGDGTFERVAANVIGGLTLGGGRWADYDNDGFLDLYTTSARDLGVSFYHNQGNGTLLRLTDAAVVGPILGEHTFSGSASVGDYDNDGFLDIFVANGAFRGDLKNFLFHNLGDGTFGKVAAGSLVTDLYDSWAGAWADYDDDGRIDLFVTSNGGFTSSGLPEDNQFYHNDGAAGFTRLTPTQTGVPAHDGGYSRGCTWGDYDNDGHLDLFVAGRTNLLYHNKGDGTFTKINTGVIPGSDISVETIGCTWVDYDNDGHLDLFVINVAGNNFLFHNSGDGTFTQVLTGSLVNDGATFASIDCAWADYDNDGFQDVVVVGNQGGKNEIFHNNGNNNHWITFKLVGTASNRAAIGAKVRLQTTINGKSVWQRRDISASDSLGSQSDLRASFGLGDAASVETVRIEWPSGAVQELHDLTGNQFLTVTEPAQLKGSIVDGKYQLSLHGGIGFAYEVQSSPDLKHWNPFSNISTTKMVTTVLSEPAQASQMFFRAIRR